MIDIGGEDARVGERGGELARLGPLAGARIEDDTWREMGDAPHGHARGGVLHPDASVFIESRGEAGAHERRDGVPGRGMRREFECLACGVARPLNIERDRRAGMGVERESDGLVLIEVGSPRAKERLGVTQEHCDLGERVGRQLKRRNRERACRRGVERERIRCQSIEALDLEFRDSAEDGVD